MTKTDGGFFDILVCVDGSDKSQKALLKAISMSEKFGSKLTILLVIEERLVDFWADTEFKPRDIKSQVSLKKDSRIYKKSKKFLDEFAKRVPSKIKCSTKILTGDPAKVILNYEKKNKPDLIILGSRGLGGFSKLLVGSVSTKVFNHSSTSLMVIK